MIQLHPARAEEMAAAESLWTQVFGDDPTFQRRFYALCGVDAPLVLLENGELRSMLALPEVTVTFGDGWSVRAGYIYALATHPDARGRGYAAQLIDYAAERLRNRGADCLLTVPAEPSLFDFFGRCGFHPAFHHQKLYAEPIPAPAVPLSPENYNALRETLLADRTRVTYTTGQLDFQRTLCPHADSGLYRLELAHGPACAAVENWPGAPVAKELLCAPGDEAQGAAAISALCGQPSEVRVPAFEEEGVPFGGIRWLFALPPTRWRKAPAGYLGLGFD